MYNVGVTMCLLFHNSPWCGSSHGRRHGRLRSRQNSAALRFNAHIHRPYCVDVHIRGRRTVAARLSLSRRSGRLRSRQNSASLRFNAHIHRPYCVDVHIRGRRTVVARSSLRAITFAPKLRCAPTRIPQLTPLSRRLQSC
jgi:hypothetical protein